MTLAAPTAQELQECCWSDAYKSLYGFRPRHTPSREELVRFWAEYPAAFERMQAEEDAQLAELGFPSWTAYYDYLEEKEEAEYRAWQAEQAEKKAYADAYLTPFHTLPVIEAWEYGALR